MVRLLETDHLNDQLAALAWLRTQKFVEGDRIAVAGNSFGGIEAVLGAERGLYCAAIDSAGGAQSWSEAPEQVFVALAGYLRDTPARDLHSVAAENRRRRDAAAEV